MSSVVLPEDRGQSAFTLEDYRDIYPPGIGRHYWNSARNRIIHQLVKKLASEGDTILDVGCGPGLVTSYLRARGIDCYGCDLGVAPACDAGTSPYLSMGADACDLDPGLRSRVRVILLLDVLEHLESPRGMIARLGAAFPTLRSILFTVPARMDIWSNYDERNRHYIRYDGKSVGSLAIPGKFELVRWGYFFHVLYPPARLMKLLSIDRREQIRPPRAPRVHAMIASALLADFAILPRRLPGSSIHGVLRRVSQV